MIGPKLTSTTAHGPLLALLPHDPHVLYSFHIGMLRHGQKICVWGKCLLTDLCDWYKENRAETASS